MGNFKRGRAKNRRSGCLMCKPHKGNGAKGKRPVRERLVDLGDGGTLFCDFVSASVEDRAYGVMK